MSASNFLSVYNLANLTAPASGVTHSAKFQIFLIGGETVRLNMLSQMEFLGVFLGQSMQVDNSANSDAVVINETTYGWTRTIPAGALQTFQYPAVQNQNFVFTSAGNVSFVIGIFDWPAFPDGNGGAASAASSVVVTNTVTVTDPTLEDLVAALTPQVTLVSHSTTTVATTSTALMAASPSRRYLLIQAPRAADLWINPLGNAASIDGADCFLIPANSSYESGAYIWNSAINYFCATGGLNLSAVEGG